MTETSADSLTSTGDDGDRGSLCDNARQADPQLYARTRVDWARWPPTLGGRPPPSARPRSLSDPSSLRPHATRARDASRIVASCTGAARTRALTRIAEAIRDGRADLLAANQEDVAAGRTAGLDAAFLDRLALSDARIDAMADAVDAIAAQDDPVGRVELQQIRPNGLRVGRVRTPLGVIAVIYEARPNVTSDAAALALRSGNAILLKGGSHARRSNRAVGQAVAAGLEAGGLPPDAVQVITDHPREAIAELLTFDDLIDLVIPRGGEGLIRFVAEQSRIPVVKHYKGVCHVYLHDDAPLDRAVAIAVNAKASRPAVCNSAETLLVSAAAAARLLPDVGRALLDAGVTLHADVRARAELPIDPGVVAATDADWDAEYLSLDLAVGVVDGLDGAIDHIRRHTSDHTEAIVTASIEAADRFTREITSSCVMVNASTRFADGGQLGLGAEIGISTSRVHAYGPMGADGLTTTRFVVLGEGHVRT